MRRIYGFGSRVFQKGVLGLVLMGAVLTMSLPSYAEYTYKDIEQKQVAPVLKVPIKKIIVSGNSLITSQEISAVTSPYEGKSISYQDSFKIAAAITQVYRKAGYFLAYAYVPYQRITNGVLQINVVEGKLGSVRVEGNKAYSTAFIMWNFKPAMQGGTLQYDRLQRAIMLLNENTDLSVKSVLLPGKTPGTTDIVLKVEDKTPNHISGDYNNFGTLSGGQNQPNATFAFGNLIGQGDNLTLNAMYPMPNSKTTLGTPIFSANYSVPLDNKGLKLTAAYSSADVRLGASLDVLNVVGNTNVTSLGVTRALARADTHSSNLTATFNDKNSHNFQLGALSTVYFVRDVALGYNATWLSGSGSNSFSSTVTQGLGNMLGGSGSPCPLCTTSPGTDPASNTFTKLGWTLSRVQSLGGGYLVILKAGGQFAFNNLVTSEQFLIGGPESVRGYRAAELSGDSGENGTVEFRFPLLTKPKSNLAFSLFMDTGRINNHYSTAGTAGTRHLTGGGCGIRANMGDNTTLRADIGWPLDTKPNSTGERPVFYGEFSTQFL